MPLAAPAVSESKSQGRDRFLAEASLLLSESLDPISVFERLSQLAVPTLADRCAVYLRQGDELHLVALGGGTDSSQLGRSRHVLPARQKNIAAWRVIESGQSELTSQITGEHLARVAASTDDLRELLKLGMRSGMTVPLVARGRVLGALSFVSCQPDRVYDADDVAFTEDLGRRAALAHETARLLELERAARAEAEAAADRILRLHNLARILAEAGSAEEATRIAAKAARDAVSATFSYVWLANAAGTELRLAANEGYDGPGVDAFRVLPATLQLPATDAFRTGAPVILHDPDERRARYPHLEGVGHLAPRSWAVVPLRARGRALGVLGLSFSAPRAFSEDEVTFLSMVGQQCASAVDRAGLVEAQRESEERLRSALSAAATGTWRVDREGMRTAGDAEFNALLGLPADSRVEVTSLILPDDLPRLHEAARRCFEEGAAYEEEFRVSRPDGEVRWLRSRGRPVKGPEGTITHLTGATVDVTSLKVAESRLREESSINETLHRISASFAGELDPDRLAQLVTDEATALTGARFGAFFFNVEDDHGGVYQLYTLSGADKETFRKFRMHRATPIFGPTFRGEGTVLIDDVTRDPRFGAWGPQPEGHPPVRSYLAAPVKSRGGVVLGGLFFGHPEAGRFTRAHARMIEGITAHAAIALEAARLYKTVSTQKEQLTEAVQRAGEADRRKDEFLAMLGHELRNPLAPMATAIHLMKLKGAGGEREREVIERQVRHLSRLVDDLLDLSRITRGKIDLRKERIEASTAIAKGLEMASPLLEKYAHNVAIEVPREGLPIDGDSVRLAQVFQNLLTNAAKYTEPGGHISISSARDGQAVVVRVQDDGIGIPAELLPRVFDAFVQGERSIDRAEGGLGIGLTLVRKLVELQGGTVSAHSEGAGRGSLFEVRLPLAAGKLKTDPALKRLSSPSKVRRRVLVVDDNVDAAAMLAEMLRLYGSEVRVAHDGPEALTVAEQFAPDLALLDIGLPVMDGYELCGRLREKYAKLETVAITGYGLDADRERARAAGFDAHLVKPVDLSELEALVNEPPR